MAIKHNQQIPNNHFHKDWQRRVRVHFEQAGRKNRRRQARIAKAAAVAPRPVDKLKPVVRCPTIKYNRRVRAGRGFTVLELKEAGIPRKLAPTIGIALDPRRRNLSSEGVAANVERLKAYRARLILFPRKSGQHKKLDASKEEVSEVNKHHHEHHEDHEDHESSSGKSKYATGLQKSTRRRAGILPIVNPTLEDAVTEVKRSSMPKGEEAAYKKLRAARSDARLVGVREKRAKAKAEEAETKKK